MTLLCESEKLCVVLRSLLVGGLAADRAEEPLSTLEGQVAMSLEVDDSVPLTMPKGWRDDSLHFDHHPLTTHVGLIDPSNLDFYCSHVLLLELVCRLLLAASAPILQIGQPLASIKLKDS